MANSVPRISAIVPAYNEAEHISHVLDVLCTYRGFSEIIVVDDGSTDETARLVKRYPVTYLHHQPNRGKGYAMDQGVQRASGDILFFSDADILGLTPEVIDRILGPVASGSVEMSVGVRGRGIPPVMGILARIFPVTMLISGERALTRRLWEQLPLFYKKGFRIESGLNYYARYLGQGLSYTVCPELQQTIKEQKYGFWAGFVRRLGMIYDIIIARGKLYLSSSDEQL
jgi:glycosyltransferase involved in cell wall biosynthesis